jgi:hypothetical protein
MHDLITSMAGVAGAGAPPPAMGFSLFTGIIPAVLGCAYPIALLIALNTKSIRDYYRFDGAAGRETAA